MKHRALSQNIEVLTRIKRNKKVFKVSCRKKFIIDYLNERIEWNDIESAGSKSLADPRRNHRWAIKTLQCNETSIKCSSLCQTRRGGKLLFCNRLLMQHSISWNEHFLLTQVIRDFTFECRLQSYISRDGKLAAKWLMTLRSSYKVFTPRKLYSVMSV